MKQIFILLLGLLPFLPVKADDNSSLDIPIKQAPGNPGSFPRTPNATTPITAYYQSGVIYIQFSEDLGCLDIEVINSTTNQQWIDVACSDNSTEAIVISATPGNYTITLTTDDGIEYSGKFIL